MYLQSFDFLKQVLHWGGGGQTKKRNNIFVRKCIAFVIVVLGVILVVMSVDSLVE